MLGAALIHLTAEGDYSKGRSLNHLFFQNDISWLSISKRPEKQKACFFKKQAFSSELPINRCEV
jgi:hypothetical protein